LRPQTDIMIAKNSYSDFFLGEGIYPENIDAYDYYYEITAAQLVVTGDSVSQQQERPVPTKEQIRYWKQREVDKMFHGKQKEINLPISGTIETKDRIATDLVLPERSFSEVRQDWFTLIIFLALILFVSVRHMFGKYLGTLFQSLFNHTTASRMYRERNISLGQAEFRLELFTYLVLGLLFFQMSEIYRLNLPFEGFLNYLSALFLITIFISFKKLIYRLLGYVIEKTTDTGEYLYNFSNYLKVMGILSLPVVLLIAWSPISNKDTLLVSGMTIISILYLFLLWRGIRIFLKKQFSVFYLFLYLCTLEILPLLLMVKLVTE
jgi:hypothetical protein